MSSCALTDEVSTGAREAYDDSVSSTKKERREFGLTLSRCLRLRCPVCGDASIFERPFQIKHHCPACRALFKREEGFFVGAIIANVLTTELAVLLTYLICLPLAGSRFDLLLGILFAVALAFPVAFYHHSWSAWLSADYLIESLPKYTAHGRARRGGDNVRRDAPPRNGSG
ncbi:MAG: hypothetical protein QOE33_1448 [Acidobacteriota bacterium]|nr:hypothetical protein [Acidobacteriota bacterium]